MANPLSILVDNSYSSPVDLHETNAIRSSIPPINAQLLILTITQYSSSLSQSFFEHSLIAGILAILMSISVDILSHSVGLLVVSFS